MGTTLTAPPKPTAALSTVPAHHHWPTPRRLVAALAALWLAALLLLLVALWGVGQRRQALQVIGRDTALNIVNAQQIKADLSDMDASAAQVLLLPPGIAQEAADDHYEKRRVEATGLTEAASGAGYRGAAQQQLQTLTSALGTYETDVAQARLLHLRGEPGSRLVYRMTHSEMHDTLLPAADALRAASSQTLEAASRRQQASSKTTLALLWVSGLLLLALLIGTQLFLLRLTRRTLSLPLVGATLLTLIFLLYTSALWTRQGDTLGTVSRAFASVSGVWEMRATAFDMNSEESRWLMDTPQAPQYEQLYAAQSAHLADVLGRQADAPEITAAFAAYGVTDRRLRALEDGGNPSGAVRYCVGTGPGQHQGTFDQFDAALGRTLEAGQNDLEGAVSEAEHRQAGYDILALLAVVGAAALIGLGLRPRLLEYAP